MFKKIERYMDRIFNTKPTLTFRSSFDVFMAGILIVPAMLIAFALEAKENYEDTVAVLMVLIFGLGGLVLFGFGIYELALLLKGTL